MREFLICLALASATPALADQDARPLDGNREMAEMFAADQEARRSFSPDKDWGEIARQDAERRVRTRELLDTGRLTTGPDFYAAAFIFQHGDKPEDYLLAHALAVRALGLGMENAEWIAAATLDRYLHSIDREQIYGTQYRTPRDEPTTQGRYNRQLLTDQIRTGARVETLEGQAARLKRFKSPTQSEE